MPSSATPLPLLVSPAFLAAHLADPGLKVIDASWHMPDSGRDAAAQFAAHHIPGALRFDIDAISDQNSPLPHMLPTAEAFAAHIGALGIGNDDAIVIYDDSAVKSAARAWWMFKVFGHERVALLDGGFKAWTGQGYPVEAGISTPAARAYQTRLNPALVRDLAAIRAHPGGQLLDARGPARFSGAEADPRPGVRAGHIPGAKNLHYGKLFTAEGTWRGEDELRDLFAQAGIDLDRPLVTSCGSGVTACVLAFALARLGRETAVYDGSWSEWGSRPDTPIETGTPR